MSIGLKKGTVVLEPHQKDWEIEGAYVCKRIKAILGDDVVDVKHIGSTSIRWICAKPVIDVAVAVRSFEDIMKHNEELSDNGIVYRGQDILGQHLYRSGDLDNDIVTHFIHVVIADSLAWHNYIDFKDYLNEHPEDAKAYECLKKELCVRYPDDRKSYVKWKEKIIDDILAKARVWHAG